MKSKTITVLILFILPIFGLAQDRCSAFFTYRKAVPPYGFNDQSKSAICMTGKSYELHLPLTKGKDYRLKFFAAAVFNNNLRFKIIDQGTHETVLDLPGKSESGEEGSCVLADYFDEASGKSIHPYFDFYPATSTTLKVIIEIDDLPQPQNSSTSFKKQKRVAKGCVTIVVLDKPSDDSTF